MNFSKLHFVIQHSIHKIVISEYCNIFGEEMCCDTNKGYCKWKLDTSVVTELWSHGIKVWYFHYILCQKIIKQMACQNNPQISIEKYLCYIICIALKHRGPVLIIWISVWELCSQCITYTVVIEDTVNNWFYWSPSYSGLHRHSSLVLTSWKREAGPIRRFPLTFICLIFWVRTLI